MCFWWDKSHLDLEMIGSQAMTHYPFMSNSGPFISFISFISHVHFPCHIMSPYVTHVALRCTSLHCVALHPPGKMWMAPWSYFQHLVLRLLQTRPLHHGELWSLMEARLARKPPKFQIVAMRRNFRDIPPGWAQCKKMNEWLDPALPRSLN